jgi:hypothetical protein
MNFTYGEKNKVFGKDIKEARYNALLETFYYFYPELRRKLKVGKNYYNRDPNTAHLLEKRVLGEGVYIPDEDKDILYRLADAYETTKIDLETCVKQTGEQSCKNLKFKGINRCEFEKKWFSYVRGGNCFISEGIVKHLLDSLDFIKIDWDNLNAKIVNKTKGSFLNPDKLTKTDMANILHDLTYHGKILFKDIDLIDTLEKRHGKDLVDFTIDELLYYIYLLSFIVYVSKFLLHVDFKKFLSKPNITELAKLLNKSPSKNNLAEFIFFFLKTLPKKSEKQLEEENRNIIDKISRLTEKWAFTIFLASFISILVFTKAPPEQIVKMLNQTIETMDKEKLLYKVTGMPTTPEGILTEIANYII